MLSLENILIIGVIIILLYVATQNGIIQSTQSIENFTPETQIAGYEYKGCYIEKTATPLISHKIGKVKNISECAQKAKTLGHNTIGYQSGEMCYSGSNSNYAKSGKQDSKKCSVSSLASETNLVYVQLPETKPEKCPVVEEKKCPVLTCPSMMCPECPQCTTCETCPECSSTGSTNYTPYYVAIGILAVIVFILIVLLATSGHPYQSQTTKLHIPLENIPPVQQISNEILSPISTVSDTVNTMEVMSPVSDVGIIN